MNYELGIRGKIGRFSGGFTLIEFLLYIGLTGIIFSAIVGLITIIFSVNAKNTAITEVEENGVFISDTLNILIRNASSITTPTVGQQGNTLILTSANSSESPIIFSATSSQLTLQRGSNASVPLSSRSVRVTNLTFQNLTGASSSGSVRYSFTLSHVNPSNINVNSFSKTFTGGVNVK